MSTNKLRIIVGAGKASAAPPLGPALGQRGIQIPKFTKEFNDQTGHLKPGTPMRVVVNSDRQAKTYAFKVMNPQTSWFLKKAAGVEKLAHHPNRADPIATLSLKHCYEIAAAKKRGDASMDRFTLQGMVRTVVAQARNTGIYIVKGRKDDPDPNAKKEDA